MIAVYYACGGFYRQRDGTKKFKLTSPSINKNVKGDKPLPYITNNVIMGDKLFWHSKHNSHLYKLIVNGTKVIAICVSVSWEAEDYVGYSSPVELESTLADLVLAVINNNKFWEI